MWFSPDGATPLGGNSYPVEVVANVPVEAHDYREEQDPSFGYWTRMCFTCNRYFGYEGAKGHESYVAQAIKKYNFMLKRQALLEKTSD